MTALVISAAASLAYGGLLGWLVTLLPRAPREQ